MEKDKTRSSNPYFSAKVILERLHVALAPQMAHQQHLGGDNHGAETAHALRLVVDEPRRIVAGRREAKDRQLERLLSNLFHVLLVPAGRFFLFLLDF